ncbi:MAG TPA: MogA/MoaB family molybdenum cofactor biosynthesis protein [Chloroflexi bacterium]|nr:MogA/MoaB family molybdenum cofactor biosynthesis protein [Chloroflexota bacterium]
MRVAVLTISDRAARGEREDLSGPRLQEMIRARGWEVAAVGLVSDEPDEIAAHLKVWADQDMADVVLTTGGTGFSPRDQTPEATRSILDRLAPGLAEAMRAASLRKTPHAMLSRGVAGIRARTLIVNLPGSPRAAAENLDVILPVLPHAVALLRESPDAEQGHSPPGSIRQV